MQRASELARERKRRRDGKMERKREKERARVRERDGETESQRHSLGTVAQRQIDASEIKTQKSAERTGHSVNEQIIL